MMLEIVPGRSALTMDIDEDQQKPALKIKRATRLVQGTVSQMLTDSSCRDTKNINSGGCRTYTFSVVYIVSVVVSVGCN